ncbi:hypothetical protein RB195_003774 [Necator americanus]|uniref:Uncharacterized protein n=1 Tax=Necator americanus TaxID=51031 RepID=A0ABR1DQ34_NECAM
MASTGGAKCTPAKKKNKRNATAVVALIEGDRTIIIYFCSDPIMSGINLCSSQFQDNDQSEVHKTVNNEVVEGEEDLVDLCRQLDTQLEEKAKMHNLNALNVKSILHRLIKDPHVLSALMGIKGDSDDIPALKVTRSKVKHTSSESARVELKPVQPPRTFLDVNFENEDDDEDYRPDEVQSDESDDEEDPNDTVVVDPENVEDHEELIPSGVEKSSDKADDKLMISNNINNDREASSYQLRSRVSHVEQSCTSSSLYPSYTQESFDTFIDCGGQEMLTFVENPDYLDFLQGIHASTSACGSENVATDDDDPDDEEYNVLTELEKLEELERDKDELRMDRFTEIPMREVEGLFLDLIGDDMETIRPDLISLNAQTPKKKRPKKRRSTEELSNSKRSAVHPKVLLPVDGPPPDGSYSCSLISGEPITFKPEELAQLRIQLEQHVQLLTQSVVMCYHDTRLTHVKNEYQLMINALDSFYYDSGGDSSLFNINNLGAAIESCHDIMGVTAVEEELVKWDPNPFGWSPRPEAALVLGRSRAIIYPDLLPGVQPDLFEFPHQFFTPGEDLLLAHALIQFRHIPQSTSQDPFGRLYWVQRMLLPCKTISQIRAHIRLARNHTEGQVNVRNPIYQIIMQALRGVCHLRFPFERPLARYDTLQMWPDEERPIWYNKFLKNFMTIGPTMIIPCGIASKKPASLLQGCEGISPVSPAVLFPERRSNISVCSSSIFYEVNVAFQRDEEVRGTLVYARPFSYCYESASGHFCSSTKTVGTLQKAASFGMIKAIPFTTSRNPLPAHVKLEAQTVIREQSYELDSLMKPWCREIAIQDLSCDLSLYPPPDSLSHNSAPLPPGTCEAVDHEFTVYEPSREFYPSPSLLRQESLQLPKSEFSVDNRSVEPEEEETTSGKRSVQTSTDADGLRTSGYISLYDFQTREASKSKPSSSKNISNSTETSNCRENRGLTHSGATHQKSRRNSESVFDRSYRGTRRSRVRRRSRDFECELGDFHQSKRLKRLPEISIESVQGSRRHEQRTNDSDFYKSTEKEKKSSSRRLLSGRAANENDPNVCGSACTIDYEFKANEMTGNVLIQLNSRTKQVIRLKENLKKSATTLLQLTDVSPQERSPSDCSFVSGGNTFMDIAQIFDSSPIKCWEDNNRVSDGFRLHHSSEASGDSAPRVDNNYVVPRTPTFSTPSSCSSATFYQLSVSTSQSPISDYGLPATPRDDMLTRSPILLRAPSAASRALFAKIEIKSVPKVPVANVDLASVAASTNCWRSTWNCENNCSTLYNDQARPSSASDGAGRDDSEDMPGSKSFDDLDPGGKTRMKRRTRTEKERMGLERMQNLHHRSSRMQCLARKIADDIRQRTFMHQDVWRSVEKIVLGDDNLESQFDCLKAALLPKHADVFVLLSLLADDSILPPEILTSPLRRAYYGAVQMLLAIEAYCHGTRSRSSNTRSLLKTIGTMGQALNETDFCDRLYDLLSNERPLWSYVRQWLPLPYEEDVTSADFEFIDLRKTVDKEFVQDDGAECIDDLNEVLGPLSSRKGLLQVAGGQLNFLQNASYIPVLINREKEYLEENKMPQEPIWTKDVDILILKTYNSMDGSCEDVANILAQKLPYSLKEIATRLNFLVSLF